jgi:N-methylhydantoinase A/oxoprolinase/acetone carboxylase beta subunit
VLEIGRQSRTRLYSAILDPETPVFLAPGRRRVGVRERINAQGEVWEPLELEDVEAATIKLKEEGSEAIAISFLFAFVNPAHEIAARDVINRVCPDMPVSLSSEVDPAFREYERTVVTSFDAYVKPIVARYIENLETGLAKGGVHARLRIMQSRGGVMASTLARGRPVRLFLSGPAAGVIGAKIVAGAADHSNVISIDVGGTSSDIALIHQGTPILRAEGRIAGYPVRTSMLDVNAIGSGGGSIAWIDDGGGLRVGPESAGADPGPACYDRGGREATVTDAAVVLGYLNPDNFAGGTLGLDKQLAVAAVQERIADPLSMSVEEAALGIFKVAVTQMAEGVRYVSVRQGFDPRRFALVPMGGAGPLHACALADDLGMTSIVVPPNPGVLSAMGLLAAPIEHEIAGAYAHSLDSVTPEQVKQRLAELDAKCSSLMHDEGIDLNKVTRHHFADICYEGQSYFIQTPLSPERPNFLVECYEAFLKLHDSVYGYAARLPAKFVNLRAVHSLENFENSRALQRFLSGQFITGPTDHGTSSKRPVWFSSGPVKTCPIYTRNAVSTLGSVAGPAIIEQADTTVVVEPGWSCAPHKSGNLIMTRIAECIGSPSDS